LSSAEEEELLRATGVNVCDGTRDLLVHACWNAAWVIPETTEDFVWPVGNPSIGCNALCCANCRVRLRNMPDFRLADSVGAGACAQLFDLADWSSAAATGLAVPSEGSRSYVCRCNGIDLSFVRPLRAGAGGSIADENPAPAGWHCAGHPRLPLPTVLDGVPLVGAASLAPKVIAAMLRAELPVSRPHWLDAHNAQWLARLWYLLEDRALAAHLVAVVAGFLRPDCGEVIAALDFFTMLPMVAAEAARAPLAQNFVAFRRDSSEEKPTVVDATRLERLLLRMESRFGGQP